MNFSHFVKTILVVAFLVPSLAHAQLPPTQGGGPLTGPGGQAPKKDKPEGPAEAAPSDEASLPTTPVLPPRKSERARYQLFELDGYLRWRGDWLKKFNLGFNDDAVLGGAPFPNPLACADGDPAKPCRSTIKSSNMRLRLEPIISLQENATQIFMQVDVLDNVVLGSTPLGFTGNGATDPVGLETGVADPQSGLNSTQDSIRVKRVWAEGETALGRVHFGRMPWHWGLGVYASGGGRDPIHGTYDLDSDYGTTVDRIMFAREIPGTKLVGSVAMDWTSTFPSSDQTGVFADRAGGQPFDLEDNDDVNQWVFTIGRLDSPKEFDAKVARGDIALNYGGFLAYRTQSWEQSGYVTGTDPDPASFVRRGVKAYIPDIWLRFVAGQFDFEFEGVAILGEVDEADDLVDPSSGNALTQSIDLRKFGGVAKGGYRLLDGDIRLGMEVGFASGDQWDNAVPGRTHVRNASSLPGEGDTTAGAFRFNFDYKVDLILFRELLGTVTNATYFKPNFEWAIGGGFRAKSAAILSFANIPVSTPGNDSMYGVEFDADIGYEKDGFLAGIAYGVLFPLGALNHPAASPDEGPGFGYAGNNVGEAEAAQTIQMRLMFQF